MSRWEQRRPFTPKPFRVECRHPEHKCRARSFSSYVTAHDHFKRISERGCDPLLVEPRRASPEART